MKLKSTICALIALLLPLIAAAQPADSVLYRKMQQKLAVAAFNADSLAILNNMFDLVVQPRSLRNDIGRQIIETANRSNNTDVAFDAIRRIVNFNLRDDAMVDSMMTLTESYPESPQREITRAFINMMRNSNHFKTLNDSVKTEYISLLVDNFTENPPTSTLDHIVKLHALTLLLGDSYQSELVAKYMQRLGTLVESLPDEARAIKNMYYVQAAITYLQCGMREQSIAADEKLLQIIGELETNYKLQGRQYIDYDANRYIIYTRLLSSYPLLTHEEIEKYYSKIQSYIKSDVRARNTWKRHPEAEVYYSLAHNDYKHALELLPGLAENTSDAWKRRNFLKLLIDVSRDQNRNDLLLPALNQYSAMTDTLMQHHMSSLYREMRIAYDMYDLEGQYEHLKTEKADTERRQSRNLIIFTIVTTIVLIAMVLILLMLYRRTRVLARRLRVSNRNLTEERDRLRTQQEALKQARDEAEKSDAVRAHFIKNFSSEIVPPLNAITEYAHLITDLLDEHTRPYTQMYVDKIDLNCDILRVLSQDVMLLSEIDTTRLPINPTNIDLDLLVSEAIERGKPYNRNHLEMTYVNDGVDTAIHSDPHRVSQVLAYMISNSLKFTDEGSISLRIYRTGKYVAISVTDTGIGISHKYKDKIFDRFFKVSRDTPGAGLGLHIARHIARLLGGDLRFDSAYSHGARFIFTIPVG